MAATSRMMVKPALLQGGVADRIRSRSQSLMAGVAFMYCGDSPRIKPMFSTDMAVLT